MSTPLATIDLDRDLGVIKFIVPIIGQTENLEVLLDERLESRSFPDAVIGEEGIQKMVDLTHQLAQFREYIAYILADYIMERAKTEPKDIGTAYDLTFAQAMGKLAEGLTVECRATRYKRYALVDGTLTEIELDGRSKPVKSLKDEQMGSVWRVAEGSQ